MYQEVVKLSCGEDRYIINLLVLITADGISITLTGGESPHVGGMAMSVPRPSINNSQMSCDTWITPRVGHKDDQAAALVARQVCLETGQTTAVTAGIHIDRAQPWEVERLLENCRQAADLLCSKIKELREQNNA
ncbi:Uncharacterized [Syntrophomonas zehnderi OL-4]|uniref:Uncharacterized n=1 Tax=Syntrophomonas zehnderi OL-4 TaxID=690567 RepID=A0A0E4GBI7_9FIRM|nr:hypothetical protein [Syntrophomonas zehnderi]CFX87007.1 Uncharacterized [Syntrophomonas zehnderi OL-4]